MTALDQSTRTARLNTPLTPTNPNHLVLNSFEASEGLSELFEVRCEAVSGDSMIDFDSILGKGCFVALTTPERHQRVFHGVMTEARRTGQLHDLTHYSVVLRPWLWLLAHRATCRIFMEKSVKDIIQEVFELAGFARGTDFEFKTQESYDPIPYCVQYRETDFSFVSRLMEEFGIYYYFEHNAAGHKLMLADGLGSHVNNPQTSKLRHARGFNRDLKQFLSGWVIERRFSTGRFELNDFDYLSPGKQLLADKTTNERYAHSKLEVYDYPGRYIHQSRGKTFAQFRLEAEQAFDRRRYAEGVAPSLFPGSLVQVEEHDISSEKQLYLVVRCHHGYQNQEVRTTGGAGDSYGTSYRGSYEFLTSDRPYRALPMTPKPRIHGVQTAIVVGKKGEEKEEISTDEHGRIFLMFHWDRDLTISCPVRVAQAWAGSRWGEIFIPRVGMEVVVEYLEGDPDQPLVVGCVYNGDNKVPYTLPDHKTRAGWKSDSTKGHDGYNEIYLEDKKGSEVINVHAQKDLNVKVLNNETRSVGGNMTTTIGNTETRTVGKGFKGGPGSPSSKTTIAKGDYELDVSTGAIKITAKTKIELICGPSKITIDPSGIALEAPKISIKAQALCEIQGLPVKIN